jgi:hypothetical protein
MATNSAKKLARLGKTEKKLKNIPRRRYRCLIKDISKFASIAKGIYGENYIKKLRKEWD